MTMLPLADSLSEEQVLQPGIEAYMGVDAYIYGYSFVLMNVTKDVSTAVPAPRLMKAPVNQFAHLDAFNLLMRLYYPKPEVLDGTWFPPPWSESCSRRSSKVFVINFL